MENKERQKLLDYRYKDKLKLRQIAEKTGLKMGKIYYWLQEDYWRRELSKKQWEVSGKGWKESHKEYTSLKNKEYRNSHPEKIKEFNKKWNKINGQRKKEEELGKL